MNHQDHLFLIREGVPSPGGVWAELGSGRGAFTLALAELIGPAGEIHSVDRDARALSDQEHAIAARLAGRQPAMHYRAADYMQPLDLPPLDGILMANTLHFQRDKKNLLASILEYLHPGGRLVLVEYNVDHSNPWVPHPLSYPTWETLAREAGFSSTRKLAVRPSRFLSEIYSALSIK